jgi:hypothetical protein
MVWYVWLFVVLLLLLSSLVSYDVFVVGNTRVVEQQDLQVFREELAKTERNPYQFVLHRNKVWLSSMV